jgi:predicted AAA+ superfamily ATPase
MYVEREIKQKFEKLKKVYSILALVGARQCGKTTFLKEHVKSIKSNYLLFDDPDIRRLFENDLKKFEKLYLEGFDLALFDEVQYCKDAGRNLKYFADSGRKIWLTSSSEAILNKEVLSYLVGRVSILKLYPFSLGEFINAKNQKAFDNKILERLIWEHAIFGGYPKAVLEKEIEIKKIILKDLYDTMVLKDTARVFSIDDISSLEEMIKYLAVKTSKILSYNDSSRDLSLPFQTIKKYLNALEKSYLLKRVKPFFKNKLKEITKQPKIYFIDTGLRNSIINSFNPELSGELFENYVFCELVKIELEPKYWRTKSGIEIDFIIEREKEIIPIEVKIKEQESGLSSLYSFIDIYKPKKAFIVSYNSESKKIENFNGCKIISCNVLELVKELY